MPLEFLNVPEGQICKSTLNANAARTMISVTKLDPPRRLAEIEAGFKVRLLVHQIARDVRYQ